jgi:hypothetical protein
MPASRRACKNALKKAVEYKNEDLLKETKAKMKVCQSGKGQARSVRSRHVFFYKSVKDADNFLKGRPAHTRKQA